MPSNRMVLSSSMHGGYLLAGGFQNKLKMIINSLHTHKAFKLSAHTQKGCFVKHYRELLQKVELHGNPGRPGDGGGGLPGRDV